MFKDAIICLLAAALIQPYWTLVIKAWEIIVTYAITYVALFIVIADLEEWIKRQSKKGKTGKIQKKIHVLEEHTEGRREKR